MKPPGDVLHRADYMVDSIPLGLAKELVTAFHYAGKAATSAVYRHGLFRRDDQFNCYGAALWMPPTRPAAESVHEDWRRVLTLSRLVVMPDVPTNAASYLLAQSVRLIRADGRFHTLLTYADEGRGHTGAIYRAANWDYLGYGWARGDPVWVDAAGQQVSRKTGSRSRTADEMRALGYQDTGRTRKHKFVLRLEGAVS